MNDPADKEERLRSGKAREAFRTISEVAEDLDLPQHVLRFWESKFCQIRPLKRGGNRRYYRPDDIVLLKAIRHLLHAEGYTIRGVQKLFKEQGVKVTIAQALGDPTEQVGTPPAAIPDLSVDMPPEDTSGSGIEAIQGDSSTPLLNEAVKQDLKNILEELKSIRAMLD
ncbi:MerR family transcriptional regulator [Kordiimonas sp. SCSIO 12610]|uniref:MerR family transcriptional regulator n=1 Tax=Kordiimonas sp. SCSIO 12610 TaxID=2829597 RepID=UPI00210A4CA2|nr:MerR family transcriptional regulator [Kordiimonas sp. SCSIO 12610]UTW54111.1 MerR family transcriptional regulator [Kordiimonas sp. SCSIO 12610]